MKTIELSTGTLLVATQTSDIVSALLGDEPWQLLGHPSEITGEVWGKVCETKRIKQSWEDVMSQVWVNYNRGSDIDLYVDTSSQSGLSLCAAHNIQESDVLLFKAKNKEDD